MEEIKIQWHPGFVAAMDLEFGENRKDLIYEKEYNLNTKPLEIDLLVIKKDSDVQIVNEIGKLFRGHNIVEYKSPEGLFRYFGEHHVKMTNPYAGIYYILDTVLFPTQIIVGKELNRKSHTWLSALSDKMQKQEMKELLERIGSLTQKFDRELADSVLEVSVRANKQVIEELRGDDSMCQALLEIMEPEIEKIKRDEAQKGHIYGAISMCRDLGLSDDVILKRLQEKYHLSWKEAEKYLQADS